MSYRRFNPERDTAPALSHGWLQPGERLAWPTPEFGAVNYKVHRRTGEGVPIRHPFWRALGVALISPFLLVENIRNFLYGILDGPEAPQPIAFGKRWDCLAARLADADDYHSIWVLTDRRFASVSADPLSGTSDTTMARLGDFAKDVGQTFTGGIHTLPVESVLIRTVWQLGTDQYRYDGVVKRWRTEYDRITFPDGSGIDFPRP